MGNFLMENSVIILGSRSEVYSLCVDRKVHYLGGDGHVPEPEFVDCVKDRSWTELMETASESIKYSYIVYPVADRTRLTVTAEIAPKGLGKLTAGLNAGSRRKRELARIGGIKKALAIHMKGQTSAPSS